MRRVHKNLCPATTSASIMRRICGKNSLKNVESDNNKMLYEALLDFVLQRNGSYFLNKPRTADNIVHISASFFNVVLPAIIPPHFCNAIFCFGTLNFTSCRGLLQLHGNHVLDL